MSEALTQEEYDALRWVHDHHVLFPTVGAQSAGTPIAETHFKNWVLCRIGRYATNIHGRATPFAEVLHASSWTNVRGMSHMGEVIVALQRDNQLFESGIESPSRDFPSGTSLYSYPGLGSSDYEGGADKFYPHDVTAPDPFVGFAEEMGRPWLEVQLSSGPEVCAPKIAAWLSAVRPVVLNVAGPRESEAPGIQDKAQQLLAMVFAR